jgi:hypothetical protein
MLAQMMAVVGDVPEKLTEKPLKHRAVRCFDG